MRSFIKNWNEARKTYRKPLGIYITDEDIKGIEKRGFFSIFLEVLDHMAARHGDEYPLVYLTDTLFNKKGENMWSQYFTSFRIKLSDDQIKTLKKQKVRLYRNPQIREKPELIAILNKVWSQVHINNKLAEKYQEAIAKIPHPFIGVHIRGTDHNRMYGNNVDLKAYFDRLDGTEMPIFLATDDDNYYKAFKERYGDRVKTYSTARGTEEGVHFSNLDPYTKGEEVLIDTMILSQADFFIHGDSNIPTAVMVMNPGINRKDISTFKTH